MKHLGWLMLFAGCVTETGNPEMEQQTFTVTAHTSAPDEVSLEPGRRAASITLTSAWMVLGDVAFVAAEGCDPGAPEALVPGPRAVDLVADPEIVELALESDAFCRVTIPVQPIEDTAVPDGAPDMLRGRSFLISGTRADGLPFTISSTVDAELALGSEADPFEVGEGSDLLLAVDVASWFRGVPIDRANPDASGYIWIDEERNGDILDVFEERLETALELFADDGDHQVDEDDDLLADD